MESQITLRAIEPDDTDLIYSWENETDIWQVSNTITPFSRHIIEQYILNSHQDIFSAKQLRLMIDCIENNEIKTIGTIDLFDFEPMHRRAGTGILIASAYRGKGYASLALEQLKNYAFKTLQLNQLYCNITEDNEISVKLFCKHGFKICGKKEDWLLVEGNWKNELILQCFNPNINYGKKEK